jgi:hypothetical protein
MWKEVLRRELNFLEDVGLGLFEKKGKKRSEGSFFM